MLNVNTNQNDTKSNTDRRPLIIDHDGGIDDIVAITLQLLHTPEKIKAITITPADCYAKPAAWVTMQLRNLLAPSYNIPIGISTDEGTNPFPALWREDSWNLARISLWNNKEALNAFSYNHLPSAIDLLTQTLQDSPTHVDILATGPCTNIASVLHNQPELKKKIHRIFIMGGAFSVKGNVEETGHDGSAEWNIYNNPQAFKDVLSSGIPITLVPLDATQYTTMRPEFMTLLEQHSQINTCRLVYEILQIVIPRITIEEYHFWDILTSAVIIDPAIVQIKTLKINVAIDGPAMGKTYEDENGFVADVALWANQELFEKTILNILMKNS